jgi:hypothetical protein
MRSPYLGSVIVLVLSVNIVAWSLSVATHSGTVNVPISAPALDSQSLVAGSDTLFDEDATSATSTPPDYEEDAQSDE